MAWVSDQVRDVTPSERLVLYFLADKAREHGGYQQAWPSATYMADALGLDRKTVRSALGRLQTRGLILRGDQSLVTRRGGGKRPIAWALSVPDEGAANGE